MGPADFVCNTDTRLAVSRVINCSLDVRKVGDMGLYMGMSDSVVVCVCVGLALFLVSIISWATGPRDVDDGKEV